MANLTKQLCDIMKAAQREAAPDRAAYSFDRPQREARRISEENFLNRSIALHHTLGYVDEADWADAGENELFMLDAYMARPIVEDDLSEVFFDPENSSAEPGEYRFPREGSLVGMHTLDNGLTFVGFTAGGNWEYPLFVAIYWDGHRFRGYVPVEGNMVNPIFRCAFGSEMDSDYGPLGPYAHLMPEGYKRMNLQHCSPRDVTELCLRDLGVRIGPDNVMPVDWAAIRSEMERNIIVR